MPRVGICERDGQICFFLRLRLGRECLLEREGEAYKSYYLHESPKGEEDPEKHLVGFASKSLSTGVDVVVDEVLRWGWGQQGLPLPFDCLLTTNNGTRLGMNAQRSIESRWRDNVLISDQGP
jgi:hypothetical protein